MCSCRLFTLLTLLLAGIPIWASAQQPIGPTEDAAVTYLERNWNRHGLASRADVENLIITDVVRSRLSDATSVYLHQDINGIPVIDGQMTINVDENGHVFHAAGQLVPDLPARAVYSGSGVSPVNAVENILQEAGFSAPEPFQVVEQGFGPTRKTTLNDAGGFTYLPVTAELVYIVDDSESLRLVWDATVPLHGDDGAWRGLVDASSGKVFRLMDVLDRDNFGTAPSGSLIRKEKGTAVGMLPRPTVSETTGGGACYNVFAWPVMDPFVADPAWPADGRELVCDPADPIASPGGWHDLDGDNVPDTTITRGNNVWAFPDWENCEDNPFPLPPVPEECDPVPETADGGVSLLFDFPIDFTLDPHDYMEASVTNLFYWNNIIHDVMVHYGFDEAHGNFQQENYTTDGEDGDGVRANGQDGGGTNNANFWTPPDGTFGRMQMYLGVNNTPRMDGSLDNHVVIHEYSHGISNRMTGGPSNVNCLRNRDQMGEGWSDWHGLMLTQDGTRTRETPRSVGVFLFYDDAPNGIRPAPYSTDFAINDYTYGNTQSGLPVPHGIGFVWATILWEVTWDLIDAYGFEQDVYNADALAGNIIMLNLVNEGLTLQPCSPGFVDGRDAILEAVDVVYSDQSEEWRRDLRLTMWGGFARRGLGYFAEQGSSDVNGDNIEDFTVFSEIAPDPIVDLDIEPDGDFVTLTWTAPGDDDSDVINYHIRFFSKPILTEADWDNATVVPNANTLIPQAPGETEAFVITGLDFETEYHFAVRSDDAVNMSDLSNNVEVTTLPSPMADVPGDPIEVEVPVDGAATHAYTISNAGPSTLRYSIHFNETTEDFQRKAVPRPESSEDSEPSSRDGVEGPASAGNAQLLDEGGPDAFGYRWIDSNELDGPTYEWIDITTTGTEVELALDDRVIVDLPFDFPYYENMYDWVAIQSKGTLVFEDVFISHINQEIPDDAIPDALIAAYWDDLNPSPTSGGGAVYYDTLDDGRFVVSWVGIPHHPNQGSFTFQIILEPHGAIVMQYQEVAPTAADENSATVGIENIDGTDGLQVVYNASYVEEELAIRFTPLWVDSDPTGGQIAVGGDETITLTFDTAGLEPDTYTADMTVFTNESDDGLQEYVIPITLTVEGIGTDDNALAFEGTHRLSAVAPNPINGIATTTLEVAEVQDVRVELFDVRGRKVATPFERALVARTAQEITLDGSALAPGVYVLRISGETFSETRRLTIVR